MENIVLSFQYYIYQMIIIACFAMVGGFIMGYFARKKHEQLYNDFELMCKNLDRKWDKLSGVEKYTETVAAVKSYVNNDRTRLMQLKSEAHSLSHTEYTSILLGYLTAFIGAVTFQVTVLPVKDNLFFSIITIVVFCAVFIGVIKIIQKPRFVGRWSCYIITAIEEIENEMKDKENQLSSKQ